MQLAHDLCHNGPMKNPRKSRIAILSYSQDNQNLHSNPKFQRFSKLFEAFKDLGVEAEPVAYSDETAADVKTKLADFAAVLVWVNPIEGGTDRTKLDALLREVTAQGVYVSTHPDMILKLGTKEVLVSTKNLGWGSDAYLYPSLQQLRSEFPNRLAESSKRVLKQYRGHSGGGVWLIELEKPNPVVTEKSMVRVREAASNAPEDSMELGQFFDRCSQYFDALNKEGRMIDQPYQERISEGMVRCYLVYGKVEGFGIQEVVALHPAAVSPTKRHYHPATLPEFQRLKQLVEDDWVPAAQKILQIPSEELPALWDCDFMFGPKDKLGQDSYVLCEINVSSVSPFPESAAEPLAKAVLEKISRKTF